MNGYKNYATYAVSLWLDNDYGMYSELSEWAQECKDAMDEHDEENTAEDMLAERIEAHITEANPLAEVNGLYSDLLNSMLEDVEWTEIARTYLED